IVEDDLLSARVVEAADEICLVRNNYAVTTEPLADAIIVENLSDGTAVGPARGAAARATIMGRLVRIGQARRAMTDDESERCKITYQTDIPQLPFSNVGHFVQRKPHSAGLRPGRDFSAFQLKFRVARCTDKPSEVPPDSASEPGKQCAGD